MTPFEIVLLFLALLFALWCGFLIGKAVMKGRLREDVAAIRQDAIKKSRAVLTGQFSEQLAPLLPGFPGKPTEARFIGKPIDFLIFKGLDEKSVEEVLFVEVKTGQSRLNSVERSLRTAIEEKRVRWVEYRR